MMMERFKIKMRQVLWDYLKEQKVKAEKELEERRAIAAKKLAEKHQNNKHIKAENFNPAG